MSERVKNLLEAMLACTDAPERDSAGYYTNPAFYDYLDNREPTLDQVIAELAQVDGEVYTQMMQDDEDVEIPEIDFSFYDEAVKTWQPKPPPIGEGWVLVSIHDTESDGPMALWVSRKRDNYKLNGGW